MIKIITPISHLFKQEDVANEILSYSDGLEYRDHSVNFKEEKQFVFHCELQPIHPMSDKDFDYLQNIKNVKKNLQLVSFHVASCFDSPLLENGIFQPHGKLYQLSEMLDNAKRNFTIIKEIFGEKITVAVENNNYYPTPAYQHVADPFFLTNLVNENDLFFLYDIAHAKVSAYNQRMSYVSYKKNLPLNKTIQLHICKYGINSENLAYDAHLVPDKEEWTEIKELIECYNIKYLTIEYYKDIQNLITSLNQLKQLL